MTVVDKIASLQRLAADEAATASEAANAAAAAAELMRKHRLTQEEVDTEPVEWHRDAPLYEGGCHLDWKRHLAVGLAHLNGCRLILSNGFDKNWKAVARATLVGRAKKADLVRYLYVYLVREIERIVAMLVTTPGVTPAVARAERKSFRLGAVMAVLAKLKKEAGGAPEPAVDRWCDENIQRPKRKAKARHVNHVVSAALLRGVDAGGGIAVRKPLDG